MTNLLPQDKKVLVKKDYYARLFNLIIFSLVILFSASLILLGSFYYSLKTRSQSLQSVSDGAVKGFDALAFDNLAQEIKLANKAGEIINNLEQNPIDLLKDIVNKASGLVDIDSLKFVDNKILVEGIFSDRRSFIEFVDKLKIDFEKVESPVDNLVRAEGGRFKIDIYFNHEE